VFTGGRDTRRSPEDSGLFALLAPAVAFQSFH
jgi:hypothetical protein